MNKTKHGYRAFMEHYLIPLALFALNIGVVHVIFSISNRGFANHWLPTALTGSLVVLGSALLLKNRWALVFSISCYLLIFMVDLFGIA